MACHFELGQRPILWSILVLAGTQSTVSGGPGEAVDVVPLSVAGILRSLPTLVRWLRTGFFFSGMRACPRGV